MKNKVPNQECIQNIKATEKVLDDLHKQEEVCWAQRAKVHWLKHGDLNSKFFHNKANQKQRKNKIYSIHDPMGNTWKDSNHINSIF